MLKQLLQGIALVAGILLPLADVSAQQLFGSHSSTSARSDGSIRTADRSAPAISRAMRHSTGVTPVLSTTSGATLEFVGQNTTVQEGQRDTIQLRLTLSQALTGVHFMPIRTWSSSATFADYYCDTLVTIPPLPAGVHNLNVRFRTYNDTQREPTEYVTVEFDTLGALPPGVSVFPAQVLGSYTVAILDNDSVNAPVDSVQRVTQNNAQGVAAYLGRTVRLRGIVTSNNLNTLGYEAALQNGADGISLVRPTNAIGPNPVVGDEIDVVGTIAQDHGLTQLVAGSYRLIRHNRVLPAVHYATSLDESTESELVQLDGGYSLVNPAQWTNNPAGFTVDITNGSQTLAMRIAPGTDLINNPAPSGVFGVVGLGTQVASTTAAPFVDGYAIVPRSAADLLRVTGLSVEASRPTFALFPNPAADRITVQMEQVGAATVVDATGRVVLTASLPAGATELPVQALRPGLYVVRVGQAAQRFVKQ